MGAGTGAGRGPRGCAATQRGRPSLRSARSAWPPASWASLWPREELAPGGGDIGCSPGTGSAPRPGAGSLGGGDISSKEDGNTILYWVLTLCASTFFDLHGSLLGRTYCYLHFAEEKAEAQSG